MPRFLLDTNVLSQVVLPRGDRGVLERLRRTTSAVDGQIAAIAAANDLTLVTMNVRHFEPFRGIAVEDWSAA